MHLKMFQLDIGVVPESPGTTVGMIRILDRLHELIASKADGRPRPTQTSVDVGAAENILSAKRVRAGAPNQWARLEAIVEDPQEFHRDALQLQVQH